LEKRQLGGYPHLTNTPHAESPKGVNLWITKQWRPTPKRRMPGPVNVQPLTGVNRHRPRVPRGASPVAIHVALLRGPIGL